MRPHRLELTNQLVLGYGLHEKMTMHAPRRATEEELCGFHDGDYVDFLKRCAPLPLAIQSVPADRAGQGDTEERSVANQRLDEIQRRRRLSRLP